jgi:beta-glucanase (GH16 family)
VWQDEFDGPSLDTTKWVAEIGGGGWGNAELETYTAPPANAHIDNGILVIEARHDSTTYTSTRLKTQGKASWTYARVEARIQIPRGQGIWPAFWMLGDNITSVGWPGCGEIDIMENIGREPARVHGTVHGPGYSGANGVGHEYDLASGAFADSFHVYAIEWEAGSIKWYVDGVRNVGVQPPVLHPAQCGDRWVLAWQSGRNDDLPADDARRLCASVPALTGYFTNPCTHVSI